jgi:NarL family two-component system response regulator LiaR
MTWSFLARNRSSILYAALMAFLLFLMKWLEWRFLIADYAIEVFAGAMALVFTCLGIWLALKLIKPKTNNVYIEKEVIVKTNDFVLDELTLASLGLSKRELEVLQLMAEGLSNHQIAERLFVSLNTIKTHSARVFEKLDVQRRTQAVDKAKKLRLIP